jgi:hypothetical protein
MDRPRKDRRLDAAGGAVKFLRKVVSNKRAGLRAFDAVRAALLDQ